MTTALTLTLSPKEREQPLNAGLKFMNHRAEDRFRSAKKLGTFPPLPGGEGRGEGGQLTKLIFRLHRKSTNVRRFRASGGSCNFSISARDARRICGAIFARAWITSRRFGGEAFP